MQPYQYAPPGYMRQPSDLRRRFDARTVAALVISIVALVFVIISMVTTWWDLSITMGIPGYSFKVQGGYGLGGSCATLTMSSYPAQSMCSGFGTGESSLADVFHVAFILMLVGLILIILALVFLLIGVLRPRIGMVAFLCAMIGSILVLIAPIYVLVAAPAAFGGALGGLSSVLPGATWSANVPGFFGTGSISITYLGTTINGDTTFGGGVGWFMAFVAFALVLVAGILILSAVRAVMPMGNYMGRPMAPYGYQQPMAGQAYAPYGQPQPGYAPQPAYPQSYPPYGAPPVQPIVEPPAQTEASAPQPSPAASTCPSCGATVPPGTVFCAICGAEVG